MSAARPNCTICLHGEVREIDALLRQGTVPGRIVAAWMQKKAKAKKHGHPDRVTTFNRQTLKTHAEVCLGLVAQQVQYVAPSDVTLPGVPTMPPPISVSAAELADPAKRLDLLREALAGKINELSAKDLYAMYMAELRLQTAQAERDAKRGAVEAPPTSRDEDDLDAAMAQAAGHRPDLRVVGGRREVARR